MKQILKQPVYLGLITGIVILYIAFLSLDTFLSTSRTMLSLQLKYASMVFCFLLAVVLYKQSDNKKDSKYVVIALFFTLIADIFLLFTSNDIAGIFFFCLVQLTYLKRYNTKFFAVGLSLIPVAILVYLFAPIDPLFVIAGFYAILILSCFISTFYTELPRFNSICVRLGMFLFILCDIHVALFNQLPRNVAYHQVAAVAMWFFYLPSQLLISLSAYHFEENKRSVGIE